MELFSIVGIPLGIDKSDSQWGQAKCSSLTLIIELWATFTACSLMFSLFLNYYRCEQSIKAVMNPYKSDGKIVVLLSIREQGVAFSALFFIYIFISRQIREPVQRLPLKYLFSLAVCECNLLGTQPEVCDFLGRCLCRSGVAGLQCDSCQPGHHSFPSCQGKAAHCMYSIRQAPGKADRSAFQDSSQSNVHSSKWAAPSSALQWNPHKF